MLDIDIRSNVKELTRGLSRIEKRQIPYAIMVALTSTASDARAQVVKEIPNRFNVTKKWWLPRQPTGIKVNRATKQRLRAEVLTRAYFLPLHETGGLKLPKSGGLLIPTANTPKYGRKPAGMRRLLAGNRILRKGGAPTGHPVVTVNGKRGVYRRKTKKRGPLVMLYGYRPSAQIDKRFDFAKTIKRVVLKVFDKHFIEVLAKAIRQG